ncbi:TPA: hypothetical protein EYP26_02390 [Candidatus Bathyarchaeota archaeon]|nr:hypothetical protein [Candidatus Bathyarchaeota archaeon]
MGKIKKGVKCNVAGCDKPAVKSLSKEKLSEAKMEFSGSARAYLCEQHYKEFKKKTKKMKMLEKWRFMG